MIWVALSRDWHWWWWCGRRWPCWNGWARSVVPDVGMAVWWWVEMTGWDCTGREIDGFSLSVFLSLPLYPICWGGDLSGFVP